MIRLHATLKFSWQSAIATRMFLLTGNLAPKFAEATIALSGTPSFKSITQAVDFCVLCGRIYRQG